MFFMKKSNFFNVKMIKKFLYLFSIIGILFLGINYTFCYPTKINAYIAANVYSQPANNYFVDDNFYQCVVDAYNSTNNTKLTYTESLNDEQLETISNLDCIEKNIVNVNGLDKLKNLRSLDIRKNNLTDLDISKNVKLYSLLASDNQISNINIGTNTTLLTIWISGNKISNINVSGATNLESIIAYSNQITEIDLSNNKKLTQLYISENNLTKLNIINNILIEDLRIDDNSLSELDLTNNAKLETLFADDNKLTNINLSNNPELDWLEIENNNLTELNLTNNTKLRILRIRGNDISSLDISTNIKSLTNVLIDSEKIRSIVFYDDFDIANLSEFLEKSTKLTYINFGNNKVINPVKEYTYFLSSRISIKNEEPIEEFINKLGIMNLEAKIYNGDVEVTTGVVKDGYKLKIYSDDIIYDEMLISIFNNTSGFEDESLYRCVVDAYNYETNENVAYSHALTNNQLEQITNLECHKEDIAISNATGISNLVNLNTLILENFEFNEIELTNNSNLKYLELYGPLTNIKGINNLNKLERLGILGDFSFLNIDLTNFSKLKKLYLANEYGATTNMVVDLSKNTELEYLDISSFGLKNIDVSKNTKLTNLHLYDNNLTEINLTNNKELKKLYLPMNKLTNIDLSNNTKLNYLDVSNNELDNIDISMLSELVSIGIEENNLTEIDLSKNTKLREVQLRENKITKLDVSNNTKLFGLRVGHNPLEHNIGVYVNEEKNLERDLGILKLPNNLNLTKTSCKLIKGDIKKDNCLIYSDKIGEYTIDAEYSLFDFSRHTGHLYHLYFSENSYKGTYNVFVIEITSDKYFVNNEESYVYIGNDSKNNIQENIDINYGEVDIEENKLLVKYNNETIKNFKIKNIDFGNLHSNSDYVVINEEILYSDFIANITISDGLTYKLFNNNEEITSGSVEKDMILKVYYNEEEIL